MTGNSPRPAKRYTLDCFHEVWLSIPPFKGDHLWCSSCRIYQPLLLGEGSKHGLLFDPEGEFKSERQGKKFHGSCLFPGCPYAHDSYTHYDALRNDMHSHFMREHTRWGKPEIKVADRLPRNSPPPF